MPPILSRSAFGAFMNASTACTIASLLDVFTAHERTQGQVIRQPGAQPLDAKTSR